MSNLCINCGTPRINGKVWEEKIGISVITHTQTICPNSECQKKVEQAIADRQAKNDLLMKKKNDAKLEREKLLASS